MAVRRADVSAGAIEPSTTIWLAWQRNIPVPRAVRLTTFDPNRLATRQGARMFAYRHHKFTLE